MILRNKVRPKERLEESLAGELLDRRRARVGQSMIYYQVAGSGRPVVLIHGLGGSGRWWSRNIPRLAQQYRVYVIDLIGFGQSRKQPFILHEAAETLVGWLDQMGIQQASLVGHSMGGYISADLAARFPERVDRLVLVDAAAMPFGQSPWQHLVGMVRTLRYFSLGFFPLMLGDALRAGPLTLLKALNEILRSDLTGELDRIQAPTLVVWGEHDTLITLETGRQLQQRLESSEFALIQGAGHNPMWDQPKLFNQRVAAFLAGEADERDQTGAEK